MTTEGIARAATKQPDGQITSDFQKSCQAQESKRIKNISLFPKDKSEAYFSPSRPTQKASAVVTDVGRVAVDAEVAKTNVAEAYGEVVWS
jgi:hypothetical protein